MAYTRLKLSIIRDESLPELCKKSLDYSLVSDKPIILF
jgi:hypothetical protein